VLLFPFAINAVMAGCKPEYMPVVLAAVEAACLDEFCMHGLLATTYFSGPVVIVNGPIRKAIGMNSGVSVIPQGFAARTTFGNLDNFDKFDAFFAPLPKVTAGGVGGGGRFPGVRLVPAGVFWPSARSRSLGYNSEIGSYYMTLLLS